MKTVYDRSLLCVGARWERGVVLHCSMCSIDRARRSRVRHEVRNLRSFGHTEIKVVVVLLPLNVATTEENSTNPP